MSYCISSGDDASSAGYLVLLRHGQTAWSQTGQHTGGTDIPLTAVGERQAVEAGERLRRAFPGGFEERYVFASPLNRARRTAELAGFSNPCVLDAVREWDYGGAEGRTRGDVSAAIGGDWDLWDDGTELLHPALSGDRVETLPGGGRVMVHNGRGETLEEVSVRAGQVVMGLTPIIQAGHDVLLVAHAHILRILTTRWLGVEPGFAKLLRLETARYSVLSLYKGDNVIEHWNV